jgi:hypothetical protein
MQQLHVCLLTTFHSPVKNSLERIFTERKNTVTVQESRISTKSQFLGAEYEQTRSPFVNFFFQISSGETKETREKERDSLCWNAQKTNPRREILQLQSHPAVISWILIRQGRLYTWDRWHESKRRTSQERESRKNKTLIVAWTMDTKKCLLSFSHHFWQNRTQILFPAMYLAFGWT